MAIDTTIQYNGRNSYKVTGMLWQWPFYVTDMTHITHSFQAMCDVAQASGVRAKTKFIDSTGGQMSEVSHSFAVGVTFELKTITVPVPSGASMAILGFIQGNRTWWVAEPKSEQGETATPFNVNYQGQLSFMTPTGLYTGFIRANQILVTGSPSQPGEQLEQRLVTINQNAINLSSTVSSKTTNITHEGVYTGKIEADQIVAGTLYADRATIRSSESTSRVQIDGTNIDTYLSNVLRQRLKYDRLEFHRAGNLAGNLRAEYVDQQWQGSVLGDCLFLESAGNYIVFNAKSGSTDPSLVVGPTWVEAPHLEVDEIGVGTSDPRQWKIRASTNNLELVIQNALNKQLRFDGTNLKVDGTNVSLAGHTHDYVPTSRTINSKALTGNITLSAADVGASASGHNHDTRYYRSNLGWPYTVKLKAPNALNQNIIWTFTNGILTDAEMVV